MFKFIGKSLSQECKRVSQQKKRSERQSDSKKTLILRYFALLSQEHIQNISIFSGIWIVSLFYPRVECVWKGVHEEGESWKREHDEIESKNPLDYNTIVV